MNERSGIVSYGAYLPHFRLDRAAIGAALGTPGGRGTRSVASYDEDATSMGVEAARAALASAPAAAAPRRLCFATTTPPYQDKTNASTLHAALDLDGGALAVDLSGGARCGVAAILMACDAQTPTLAVLADLRGGLPGGNDERDGGDGAAALLIGPDAPDAPVLAELVGASSATAEFLDRWRVPGDSHSRTWEERFGAQAYLPLFEQAATDLLKQTGISADAIDHLVVAGPHTRAVRAIQAAVGARPEAADATLLPRIGSCGAAQVGIGLAHALDRAEPGQLIAVVSVADGVDMLLLRTTAALLEHRQRRRTTVEELIESGDASLPYPTYLTWRGQLHREPPRRPDPFRPEAPPAYRAREWKFAFVGSRCEECGTRHLPDNRVCIECGSIDRMLPERMADVGGRVATFTVDHLAFSLNPPVVVAVVDFDGGGRFQCELTDVDPDAVRIGDRVEMTFRRLYASGGVHNYFWKARPARVHS